MSKSTAYSCPQCRATLKLDPHTGKLACAFCGGSFDVDEIEARVDESSYARKQVKAKEAEAEAAAKNAEINSEAEAAAAAIAAAAASGDAAAMEAAVKSATEKATAAATWQGERRHKKGNAIAAMTSYTIEQWDDIIANGSQEQFDEVVGYVCTNCGAQVVADKLTVATSCQYCGSSVVVDQRLSGGFKPSFVIPFKVKADDLPDKLTAFYAKRPLLPKNFFYENQVGEVQGIYVPFWLYDGTVKGSARYDCTDTRTYILGKDDVTETDFYHCDRAGSMTFDNVPVDASERIDDDLMDSIEPFDYRDMKPFKAGFLTGFVAERFDQSPRVVLKRASGRMVTSAESAMRETVKHGTVRTEHSGFELCDPSASYVLLPVYLFNCEYGGKHYRYAVNGQTGKIVGEVPTGKKESLACFGKSFAKTTGIAAVVIAVLGLLGYVFG